MIEVYNLKQAPAFSRGSSERKVGTRRSPEASAGQRDLLVWEKSIVRGADVRRALPLNSAREE